MVTKPDANLLTPSFDFVSIKPNKTGSGDVDIDQNDGNFHASNVSLKMMILNAYELKENQLSGLPHCAESDRFDIKAKVVDPDPVVIKHLTEDQSRQMLEPILLDRFQLKFHHEMKTLPVYEMVVVKTAQSSERQPQPRPPATRASMASRRPGTK